MFFSTRFTTLLILLAVVSTTYAAACEPEYVERLNVRVFNEEFIRISGAQVNVTYQLDRTSAKGYFTATKFTDETGTVNFTLLNIERLEANLDCGIDIRVKFDSQVVTKTVVAQNHPDPVDLTVKAHLLTVHVIDENERPIEGAEVFIQNRTARTDSNGRARFIVGEGMVNLLVKYDIGKVETRVDVRQPLEYTVGIGFYPMNIIVVDDQGRKLPARIIVEGEEYLTEGELQVPKVANSKPDVQVWYGNRVQELDVDLAVQNDYTAIFDGRAPVLIEAQPEFTEETWKLYMTIVDEGSHASDLSAGGITVRYRYDTGPWESKRAYATTIPHRFGVDLAPKPEAAVLFFQIDAVDAQGNKGVFEGQVTVPEREEAPPEAETPSEIPETDGLPLGAMVAVGVVALLIYIVYRFKLSKGGEE